MKSLARIWSANGDVFPESKWPRSRSQELVVGWGGREEEVYAYLNYSVATRMICALRRAATRVIL